jgi:cytochrome c peroxidase
LEIPKNLSQTKLTTSTIHYTSQFLLGKRLFYEKRLSGDHQSSCASCHVDEANKTKNGLQIPPLWNIHHRDFKSFFWDGRVYEDPDGEIVYTGGDRPEFFDFRSGLELAIYTILTNRKEMLGSDTSLGHALDFHPEIYSQLVVKTLLETGPDESQYTYLSLFEDAYIGLKSDEATIEHIYKALAYYVEGAFRTLPSKWDLHLEGLATLSKKESRGAAIFAAKCQSCHSGPLFSDFKTHKTRESPFPLRTPPLRNIERSGPYGLSGRYSTLSSFLKNHRNDVLQPDQKNSSINDSEIESLGAFLINLTSDSNLPESYK